MKTVLYV